MMERLYLLALPILLLGHLRCQSTSPASRPPPSGYCSDAGESSTAPPRVVNDVDVHARPIGGMRAIVRRIQYPRSAKRERVQGAVVTRFIVDERGCVVQAEVVRGVDPRLDAEALRVLRTSRFEPAQKAGKAVAVQLTMPHVPCWDRTGGRGRT